MFVTYFLIILLMDIVAGNRNDLSLTFEVENKDEFCLYQKFNEAIEYVVEFGVVKGGNFDIDFKLETPSKKILYAGKRVNRREMFRFESTQMGDFKFCFSNDFSPVTHKVVYFSLRPFDEKRRESLRLEAGGSKLPVVLTVTEFRLDNIHSKMENVSAIQRFYRIQELVDRNFAEALNNKIYIYSFTGSVIIVLVSLFQVLFVKHLFNKKPSRSEFNETLIIQQKINF